jgi:hypothetical protein
MIFANEGVYERNVEYKKEKRYFGANKRISSMGTA